MPAVRLVHRNDVTLQQTRNFASTISRC